MLIKCKNIQCNKPMKGKYSSLGKCDACGYMMCKECKDWSNKIVKKHLKNMCPKN